MPQITDFAEAVIGARNIQRKNSDYTDVMLPLQNYLMFSKLITQKRMSMQGGPQIEARLKYATNDSARHTEPFQSDDVNYVDTTARGYLDWRFTEASWVYDDRLVSVNMEPDKIYDLVKSEYDSAIGSLAEKMEETGWTKPSSSSDTKQPHGIKSYIVGNTSSTGGFDGGNASGFTTGVIFDSDNATYGSKWKNYTDVYATVNQADFQTKLWEASYKTGFKSPVKMNEMGKGGLSRGYYCGWPLYVQLKTHAATQKEDVSWDLDMNGSPVYQRTPIEIASYLDSDTTGLPFFGIDWNTLYFVYDPKMWMRESKPSNAQTDSHHVFAAHTDCKWNLLCDNRRNQFILHTSSYTG